jgi:CRISPR/Cas system-associated protein Cas10 (large subunit of type III CRISPR-Cas system)
MIVVNFENANKNRCVICDKPTITGKMTCCEYCHEKFVEFCEGQYGISKKVVDQTTGISYKVPTKDIIEKGLKWEDLTKYPLWEKNEVA